MGGSKSLDRIAKRFRRDPVTIAFSSILLFIVALAIFAPWIAPFQPFDGDLSRAFREPQAGHVMGTDQYGRDMLSRILHGARISLVVGFISVGISTAIGAPLGLVGGYYGGKVDQVVVHLTDLMLAFPGILLALVIVGILGPSLTNTMIAVGIAQSPQRIRLIRGAVLSVKENTFVEAARAAGASPVAIMYRHLLPNVISPLIVVSTLGMASAILTAAGLSFLGLGAQPPQAEWGAMLSAGRNYITRAWWLSVFPGLAITITVLTMNVIGDAFRDALDPTHDLQ